MKKNTKCSIYLRIFSVFLATYMVMMIAFSIFLVSQEKEAAGIELGGNSQQISDRVVEVLNDYLDENNQITDIPQVRLEFAQKFPTSLMGGTAEAAIFTSDFELIYNTNDYLLCIYTESIDGNTHNQKFGLLNPKEWFSEEEAEELRNYLYTNRQAEKVGDIDSYSLRLDGFWVDNEMIIPDKIYVIPMYVKEIDEDGSVLASSGTRRNDMLYVTHYENIRDLPYYEVGNIIPAYNRIAENENKDELRQMVTDQSNIMNFTQKLFKPPFSTISNERVNSLVYRYYMIVPYRSAMRILEDQTVYSDFWTAVAIDIDIWDRISSTLIYVWTACLIIFSIAAYILSRQTYKIYLQQEELERQRKEMTDALAHDLKTPLSIISGYAQNLQEDVHTEKRDYYAGHITANVNRIDRIIRKMLEMSRLESDSFDLKFEEVSLSNISTEIINRYKQVCDEKFITVSLDGDAVVKADKSLIERVIDNFFINAIDYTPEGGRISIKILRNIFEIFNSGSHIAEDKINEIWYPYKKGNTERSNTKGTGLGLSISRTILELHKFSYGAKNTEDGVVFWFKFKS